MADDINYKKLSEAIEDGISRGIRKAIHQGIWLGRDQKLMLTPERDEIVAVENANLRALRDRIRGEAPVEGE